MTEQALPLTKQNMPGLISLLAKPSNSDNQTSNPAQTLVIPLSSRPLFPNFPKSISLTNKSVISALSSINASSSPFISIFLSQKETASETDTISSEKAVYNVGVLAKLSQIYKTPSGINAIVSPLKPVFLSSLLPSSPTLSQLSDTLKPLASFPGISLGNLSYPAFDTRETKETKALTSEILAMLKEMSGQSSTLREQIQSASLSNPGSLLNPSSLADFIGNVSFYDLF